jgi:hypothetical protein
MIPHFLRCCEDPVGGYHWRWWRQYAPLKRRYRPTRQHGATSQKALISIVSVSSLQVVIFLSYFSPEVNWSGDGRRHCKKRWRETKRESLVVTQGCVLFPCVGRKQAAAVALQAFNLACLDNSKNVVSHTIVCAVSREWRNLKRFTAMVNDQ